MVTRREWFRRVVGVVTGAVVASRVPSPSWPLAFHRDAFTLEMAAVTPELFTAKYVAPAAAHLAKQIDFTVGWGGFTPGDQVVIEGDGEFVVGMARGSDGVTAARLVRTHGADGTPVSAGVVG